MHLHAHEKVLLDRRRQGKTQIAAARKHHVTRGTYIGWETGTVRCPRVPVVRGLSLGERCFILRRRAGMTQRDIAARLERSLRWVRMMETGLAPATEL